MRNCTIHGLNYVADGHNVVEKFLWFAVVVVAFVVGALLVQTSFLNWMRNPVLTSIDTFNHPVQKVQFPTVTICSPVDYDQWDFLRYVL